MSIPFRYKATRDTSGLVKATGYWSGDDVYFNPDPNKIIILDDSLTIADIQPLIRDYLQAHLKHDLVRFFQEKEVRSKKTFKQGIGSGI